MKAIYESPQLEVFALETEGAILQGSPVRTSFGNEGYTSGGETEF